MLLNSVHVGVEILTSSFLARACTLNFSRHFEAEKMVITIVYD